MLEWFEHVGYGARYRWPGIASLAARDEASRLGTPPRATKWADSGELA